MLQPEIIKSLVDRVASFEFDTLPNLIAELCLNPEQKDGDGNLILISPADLSWVDTISAYQQIWRITIETLYKQYLPELQYQSKWTAEITPYTLLECRIADKVGIDKRFFTEKISTSTKDKSTLLEEIKADFKLLSVDPDKFSPALKSALPTDELERNDLLYRLLCFPPLRDLSIFYHQVHEKYSEGLKVLAASFAGLENLPLPEFRVLEPFHRSTLYFDHTVFEKYNLIWATTQPELANRQDDIQKVRDRAATKAGSFSGKFICPCCGRLENAEVPVHVLEYKFLFERNELAKDMGYLLLDKLEEEYMKQLVSTFKLLLDNLNTKENASVLILVEGQSEEEGLPILAFKKRFDLRRNKVQVYNSGSKEKLVADFKQFKKQFEHLKIVCLLDSDARKEKSELERMISNNKNKYGLIFLERGTWEDIFSIELVIETLNKLYPTGELITVGDINPAKDRLTELSRILWVKKMATFDKVLFSKTVCWQLPGDKVPPVIDDLFELVTKFLPIKGNLFKN